MMQPQPRAPAPPGASWSARPAARAIWALADHLGLARRRQFHRQRRQGAEEIGQAVARRPQGMQADACAGDRWSTAIPARCGSTSAGEEVIEVLQHHAHGAPARRSPPARPSSNAAPSGPFLLEVGISSSFHIAKFFGLTRAGARAGVIGPDGMGQQPAPSPVHRQRCGRRHPTAVSRKRSVAWRSAGRRTGRKTGEGTRRARRASTSAR